MTIKSQQTAKEFVSIGTGVTEGTRESLEGSRKLRGRNRKGGVWSIRKS